jgi:hypothetical protein
MVIERAHKSMRVRLVRAPWSQLGSVHFFTRHDLLSAKRNSLMPPVVDPHKSQLRRQHMYCPICGGHAEEIPSAINGISILCPTCGEYDVSTAVIVAEQLQRLEPEQRRAILHKAKRWQLGKRPMITMHLL